MHLFNIIKNSLAILHLNLIGKLLFSILERVIFHFLKIINFGQNAF